MVGGDALVVVVVLVVVVDSGVAELVVDVVSGDAVVVSGAVVAGAVVAEVVEGGADVEAVPELPSLQPASETARSAATATSFMSPQG